MKIKSLIIKASSVICSFAFLTAIHSLNMMCGGTYYQPKVPNSLEKYRNDR